jgi:hypothetical protein
MTVASWQLPEPDSHRQATTSLRTRRSTVAYVTVSPSIPLGARMIRVKPLALRPDLGLLVKAEPLTDERNKFAQMHEFCLRRRNVDDKRPSTLCHEMDKTFREFGITAN